MLLMKLLQLPVTSLEQRIKEEVEKNPMLEIKGSEDNDRSIPQDQEEQFEQPEQSDFKDTDSDEFYEDDDYSYRERMERDRNVEERRLDPSEGSSFTESLLRQIRLRNLDQRQRTICEEIIGSIDGSGYLGRDLQLIANDLAFRSGIEVSDNEMEHMLHEVQCSDPAGVGARSLQECLSLQLHRMANPDKSASLATTIVDKYFNQLSNKHYASLITLLKINEATLNDALDVIRHLNPKPGWGREEENKGAHYIIPDFIVSREGGVLSFSMGSRNQPHLQISSEYADMQRMLSNRDNLSKSEQQTMLFIKDKTEEAQWLIEILQQREQTLAATMSAIMKWQSAYFMSGDTNNLRPMRLKDIALMTGYDESTISRVVNQKYVQTDFGTILLKDLFAKAVVTSGGDVMATGLIKEAIQKAINEEDKRNPLTDEALAIILQNQGLKLSRRTVAKYRESMDIPVGRMRKELKS